MKSTPHKTDVVKVPRFQVMKALLRGMLLGATIISVLLVLISFVLPRAIGAIPLTVLSGSMEPTFNPGDLIVTMPLKAKEVKTLKRGDVITFQPKSGSPVLITHRIVSVGFAISGETVFVTKGDANNAQDPSIKAEQVKGRYLYHIPYLGFLANAVPATDKPLIMKIIGVALFVWAGFQLLSMLWDKKKKKKAIAKGLYNPANPFAPSKDESDLSSEASNDELS